MRAKEGFLIILSGISLVFIASGYAQSVRFIAWDKVGPCVSFSSSGGIKVGSKSYPIKLRNLPLYKEELSGSAVAKQLRSMRVPEERIKTFIGVGTIAEVLPNGVVSSPQGASLVDEDGTIRKYNLLMDGTKVVPAGIFVFKDSADWTISISESKKGIVKLADCVYVTEADTLYCAQGAKMKSSEWISLCEIQFKGEIEILENGLKLPSGTEVQLKSGQFGPEEKSSNRGSSERTIAQIDISSWVKDSLAINLLCNQVAYVVNSSGKQMMGVNGKEGKQYDRIRENTLIFSPDGNRVAFVAVKDNRHIMVADGNEGKGYDYVTNLTFSPDSRRIAYVAKSGSKWVVVVDGKEGKYFDSIMEGSPIFSPNSGRVAYAAELNGKAFFVVDETEGKYYDGFGMNLVFSPDSKRMAYSPVVGGKQFVVVDGKEGKKYDAVGSGSLIFSPDGSRIAYGAGSNDKWFVVVDEKEGKYYDGLKRGDLIFSPDSKRIAYIGKAGNKWSLVVDEIEVKMSDFIGNVHFSPDSKRLAYVAGIGGKEFVVVDGHEGKYYDGIANATLIFSPDSKRVAYGAMVKDKWLIVVDGNEGKHYDIIGGKSLIFSPDNKRAVYVAKSGPKWFVVVDESEQQQYDGVFAGANGPIVFDSVDSIHYLARQGLRINLVEKMIN